MHWTELTRAQGGAVTSAQLHQCGLTRDAIAHLVADGRLERAGQGLFIDVGAPRTYDTELWLAVLGTGGVLAFDTAAHLWGLGPRPARVCVAVRAERHITLRAGVRVYRTPVPETDVTRLNGLPITSRRWTLLDVIGRMSPRDAQRLADRALQQAWITRADISDRLRSFPSRTGNKRLRLVLAQSEDGAAARSERKLHALLRRAGIEGWLPNYEVWHNGALVAVLDVALPERRLALEVDGWAFHSDVDRFIGDRRRQNTLVAMGWTVLRFTWADLTQRPDLVARTIRQVLDSGELSGS